MDISGFFKPDKGKLLMTLAGYSMFYILDGSVLTPAENLFLPLTMTGYNSLPLAFWALRMAEELVRFYLIACFANWLIQYDAKKYKDAKPKDFWGYVLPNTINLLTMLIGYAAWYMTSSLLYSPLVRYFIPPTVPEPGSFTLDIIRVLVHLAMFYLMGSLSYWLFHYFEK